MSAKTFNKYLLNKNFAHKRLIYELIRLSNL